MIKIDSNEFDADPKKCKKLMDSLQAEALKLIKKLASSGSAVGSGRIGYPEAMFYLAECYGNGSLGLTVDHDRAFNLYVQVTKSPSHFQSNYYFY
jgi:TPR repeat protein